MTEHVFDINKIAVWPAWKMWLACLLKPWKYRMFYIDWKLHGVIDK